jgi:hypothetical protein
VKPVGIRACKQHVGFHNTPGEGKRPEDFPKSPQGLANAAAEFSEGFVNLRHYEYANRLTQQDWDAIHSLYSQLGQQYSVWSPGSSQRSGRPVPITEFVSGQSSNSGAIGGWNGLIVDLNVYRSADSLLVANALLGRIWNEARGSAQQGIQDRPKAPTFIVVDEAHNFAPSVTSDPLKARVSKKLIQIASEGRKFGLYLILATQRPTKLNAELVPECENTCILRVKSRLELSFVSEALGIDKERVSAVVPRFTGGQGFLAGRWAEGGAKEVATAPARSAVSGAGLGDEWLLGPKTFETARREVEPNGLSEARRLIQRMLEESSGPVLLASIGVALKGIGIAKPDYAGFGKMVTLLDALEFPNLRTSGYHAFLEGVHEPPGETGSVGAEKSVVDRTISWARVRVPDFPIL